MHIELKRLAVAAVGGLAAFASWGAIGIRCDYPGGNVKVLGVDEATGTVRVAPDLRDTDGHWFHFDFTVTGAAGRTLHFAFPGGGKDYLSSLGPAVSRDAGRTWRWLNADGRRHEPADAFDYAFAADEDETRFAVSIPYVQKDWEAFVAPYRSRKDVSFGTLCKSRSGRRDVECVRLPCRGRAEWLFVLTARHHACETTGNPPMEGALELALGDSSEAEWLRSHAACVFVPFMDKDGVEEGDQGKNRRPYDHNRDYAKGLYPTVRALKELIVRESAGRRIVFLDLHSPHVRSLPHCPEQDQAFTFGADDPALNAHWNVFRGHWKAAQRGGRLTYDGTYDIQAGKGYWNVMKKKWDAGFLSSDPWVRTLPNAYLATCCEFGYSLCGGVTSVPALRELGGNMFKAVIRTARDTESAEQPMRVALTFDDSLKDHLLIAAPMLEARGWRGVFNVVTDWVGKDERMMTWDDVRELVRRGHEVTTHTVSHPHLVELLQEGKTNEVRRQIAVSRDLICEKTGFVPRYMCAPYVQQNAETARICREEGLEQMSVRRVGFGGRSQDTTTRRLEGLLKEGCVRADILHHGVSAEDHGGWDSFTDAAKFAAHLDKIAALEKAGKIRVTDYDGLRSSCRLRAAAWPHHGVVALSFDDHSIGQWRSAFPLFDKYGANVTFFLSGPADADAIAFAREARLRGHDFGLHGAHHQNADEAVAKRGADAYWKSDLEPQLTALAAAGMRPRSFAYPNCRRDAATDVLFAAKGFTRLRGTPDGTVAPNPYDPKGEKLDRWRRVSETDCVFAPAADYLRMLVIGNVVIGKAYHTDLEDTLAAMRRCGTRAELVSFVSHGIAPQAGGINMPTEWLEKILAAADDAGVVIRGVR